VVSLPRGSNLPSQRMEPLFSRYRSGGLHAFPFPSRVQGEGPDFLSQEDNRLPVRSFSIGVRFSLFFASEADKSLPIEAAAQGRSAVVADILFSLVDHGRGCGLALALPRARARHTSLPLRQNRRI